MQWGTPLYSERTGKKSPDSFVGLVAQPCERLLLVVLLAQAKIAVGPDFQVTCCILDSVHDTRLSLDVSLGPGPSEHPKCEVYRA